MVVSLTMTALAFAPGADLLRSTCASCPRARRIAAQQPSAPLIVADCAALAAVSLQASAVKSFTLAAEDLTSPGFDLAKDLAEFDLAATLRYVDVEIFGAACLATGWIIGGVVSGACDSGWTTLDASERRRTLTRGYAIGAPLAVALKYSVLSQVELPSLGRSVQAAALEAQLAGLTVGNVVGDLLGMLAALLLWRWLLLGNPDLFS
jgi:hypothetical protein